jgi:hypothetical protein
MEEFVMSAIPLTAGSIETATDDDLSQFGLNFLRAGSKLFITGLVLGLIPIVHYMVGGVGHKVGEEFLNEVTLWFGCPAEKLVQIVQIGGLSMIAIGLSYVFLARRVNRQVTASERLGFKLCVTGLIAEIFAGGVLYLIFDYVFFPNFYFHPITLGKVLWLGAQLASFSIYLAGIVLVLGGIKDMVIQLRRA